MNKEHSTWRNPLDEAAREHRISNAEWVKRKREELYREMAEEFGPDVLDGLDPPPGQPRQSPSGTLAER